MNQLLGIDIGGTKTHGVVFEYGDPVREAVTGSANTQNVSVKVASENLAKLFSQLAAPHIDEVWVGAGGIDTEEDSEALSALIRVSAPSAKIYVVHDSRLLLAAGGSPVGVAVISGTGSAVWGLNAEGHEARYGGWGYLLGDEGSGYWLGREAVRHSLQRMDAGDRPDLLTELLLAQHELNSPTRLIARCYSAESPRHYLAGMARAVVEAADHGHAFSESLLSHAGRHLAHLASAAVQRLNLKGPVVLGGGIGTNAARVQAAFVETLNRDGITDVRILTEPPVYGTPMLAGFPW